MGARGYLFTKDAPKKNVDTTAPLMQVGTTSGQPMTSTSTCDLAITQIPSDFTANGHVMPGLVDVGPMCDAKCTVTFKNHTFNTYSTTGAPIIAGWRETTGLKYTV